MKLPRWLKELLGSVFEACVSDVKGRMSGFSYSWARPEDNHWGAWLVQIAPSVLEISGARTTAPRCRKTSVTRGRRDQTSPDAFTARAVRFS
jgi:hypothetical protein